MKNFTFPTDLSPYIDKYFLRAKEIITADNLNPTVTYQVFLRNGTKGVFGIDETIALLSKYVYGIKIDTLRVFALPEGACAEPCEPVMLIEGYAQELIALETMYLGIISAETSMHEGIELDFTKIKERANKIIDLTKSRDVYYFGARHWRYEFDAAISRTCFNAGFAECSTDAGAQTAGKVGVGTIPHALEAIYHHLRGQNKAVLNSTWAFDHFIDPAIPRYALVDYANREISDSLATCIELKQKLTGIRIDTCGENTMEGDINDNKGVTTRGVHGLIVQLQQQIKQLNESGLEIPFPQIMLSSGFGNPDKIQDFLDYECENKIKLFDRIAVGKVYESNIATSEIIKVNGKPIHKVGRPAQPTNRLKRVI